MVLFIDEAELLILSLLPTMTEFHAENMAFTCSGRSVFARLMFRARTRFSIFVDLDLAALSVVLLLFLKISFVFNFCDERFVHGDIIEKLRFVLLIDSSDGLGDPAVFERYVSMRHNLNEQVLKVRY